MSAVIVAGMGFGDEGKGSIVDYLTRTHKASLVVRYNGGAQAAHNVVTSEGRHHTFSQFGSGTFAGARTLLSRYMLVNPLTLLAEAGALANKGIQDVFRDVYIERRALVTTPFHVAANRILEAARSQRHGSCGMGIGETMLDFLQHGEESLFIEDLENYDRQVQKTLAIRERMLVRVKDVPRDPAMGPEWAVLETKDAFVKFYTACSDLRHQATIVGPEFLRRHLSQSTVIFEGAQGVLLDQSFGFDPFTTWTDITFNNAWDLLDGYVGQTLKLGVLRSYMTRHGAGPFVTESPEMNHPELHNGNGPWQQGFRQGHFDLVMSRYAIDAIGGVDEIALTHLDCVQGRQKICVGYKTAASSVVNLNRLALPQDITGQRKITEYLKKAVPTYTHFQGEDELINVIEQEMDAPVVIGSYGPRAEDKKPRTKIRSVA